MKKWRVRMAEVTDCPFCTRLRGGELTLVDGMRVAALTESHPHAEGHAVVVPRRHVGRIGQLDGDEYTELFAVARELLVDLEVRHQPDAFTIGMNDGPAAGQSVAHVHLHVVPRRTGDVEDPRGGVRKALPPQRPG